MLFKNKNIYSTILIKIGLHGIWIMIFYSLVIVLNYIMGRIGKIILEIYNLIN